MTVTLICLALYAAMRATNLSRRFLGISQLANLCTTALIASYFPLSLLHGRPMSGVSGLARICRLVNRMMDTLRAIGDIKDNLRRS